MGKKSRLKRERRAHRSDLLQRLEDSHQRIYKDAEEDFQASLKALGDFFAKYSAEDVVLALDVSDLWLPNISSQVKHHFALGVAVSMPQEQFAGIKRLDTYSEFCEFIGAVYKLLPSFPMLEDYIPEPDWGDVHITLNGNYPAIFYGGSVERIPDFIEAFRILRADQPEAMRDLTLAVALQDKVISHVRTETVGSAEGISSGHIEIPSESHWSDCLEALRYACEIVQLYAGNFSLDLVLEQGNFKRPTTGSSFGDAVLQGTSLPALLARINGKLIPISLRNATSVVIDYWAERAGDSPQGESIPVNHRTGRFLALRFGRDAVVEGPIRLTSRTGGLEKRFAAVLRTDKKFYLIAMLSPEELPMLGDLERQVRQLLATAGGWALMLEGRGQAMQFRRKDDSQPDPSDVKILAVLTRVATSWMHLELPKTSARVLSFPDFVSIFDSLKDPGELDNFWTYVDSYNSILGPISGITDLFASFRDSHALLIDGAIEPTMIGLDPHWGSNWRFKDLKSFWGAAPLQFPDNELTWNVEVKNDSLQRLIAKGSPTLAWSTAVGATTVQSILEILAQELDLHNGRLLELFVHCLIDAIAQRSALLIDTEIFVGRHLLIYCRANLAALATVYEDTITEANATLPLLSGWVLNDASGLSTTSVSVDVNLARLQSRLESPVDASFEVDCLIETVEGLAKLLGKQVGSHVMDDLRRTAAKLPRFTLKRIERTVDVPDFAQPKVPQPEQYKIARRDLAIVLKQQGIDASSRYELASAKKIIDSARDAMRQKVHERIAELDQKSLLLFCIEQHDELLAEYRREVFHIRQSMSHEVSFDRSMAMADAHERFTSGARNYRYLLECCLSSSAHGKTSALPSVVVQLVASIDWLFVLYGASDVLHNGIDAAGIELDHSFVPQVFYSHDREEKERQFSIEVAQAKLGIDLVQEDEVNSTWNSGDEWGLLDCAFESDLGFSFTNLVQTLLILVRWHEVGGDSELRFCYQASPTTISGKLMDLVEGLSETEAHRLVDFVTLDSTAIRRLLGKVVDESDVPVWEHTKRGNRYTIRPLVRVENGLIAWGAAAADRALNIWSGSIANGYLPADFNWPRVKEHVRAIKEGLEKKLEIQAFKVCSRITTYVVQGIDFKYRFPKEEFNDVGDFDVLAYWPDSNRWLVMECKYNQPPFCLKDARRLRERIFGTDKDKGQFAKIEGRRAFLVSHTDQLRTLLDWPAPMCAEPPSFTEVYVSRDIYWWMRNPPYEVPSQFVRIDALDGWIRSWIGD
ncbi:hypothetical protein [Nitrosomonas ureae]|uniref:Uncharacterized protein n=1 Tax=Nitrosomonas ureae TaxID=44577 RepID=A0A2T5ITN7_9PROT|nr:hypothetical protein [Nitrosomonas ureae]PTQ87246.1 hypothetical protein C8R28_10065 [Nitrosomonas ureae]